MAVRTVEERLDQLEYKVMLLEIKIFPPDTMPLDESVTNIETKVARLETENLKANQRLRRRMERRK